jgi:adenine-specific DNA-methyltransferase
MASEAGVDWQTARVLDPACGGGAFLLPVVLRMREAIKKRSATDILVNIADRIEGFEIDPFAAELAQTWLELAMSDLTAAAKTSFPRVVRVCDALEQEPKQTLFDLVVGNPPYGRTTLSPLQRERFARSLYGHANLYGVFTDIGLRWAKTGGIIAYVTPTSFLAGEYFKALRELIANESPPLAINFINARRGIFDDVLQETLLATYRKNHQANGTAVHYMNVSSQLKGEVTRAGELSLPLQASTPWFAPRIRSHQLLVNRIVRMPHRLKDWGYRVSTGPLVWNRHKGQLRSSPGRETFPLVWAEAVTPGKFEHRAAKRNHAPYFHIKGAADEWLKVDTPCVLVQRTTAKEQARRLVAAELPESFIRCHGAVVVENHLNMIRQANSAPLTVSPAALAAVLNSEIVDEVFRCISGSVSVSAFELESLPLPSPEKMTNIEKLVRSGKPSYLVGASIRALYFSGDEQ